MTASNRVKHPQSRTGIPNCFSKGADFGNCTSWQTEVSKYLDQMAPEKQDSRQLILPLTITDYYSLHHLLVQTTTPTDYHWQRLLLHLIDQSTARAPNYLPKGARSCAANRVGGRLHLNHQKLHSPFFIHLYKRFNIFELEPSVFWIKWLLKNTVCQIK